MANFAFNPDKQRILDAVDLADLISEQLPLKRAGREFKVVCPFHDDTNPSLTINPHKGIYKCFACGAGGNALTWLVNYFNMTRTEAWKLLSERTGIELNFKNERPRRPRPVSTSNNEATHHPADAQFPEYVDLDPAAIVRAHQTALSFYRTILKHQTHGNEARAIYAQRDISPEMIARFELGAAPGGNKWDGLVQTLAAQNVDLQPFLASGLISKRRSSEGYYDRFRNRLIFPIHDLLGRPIAFGARIIDKEDEPKYLNSPEHPRFNKSATLYGLNLAQRTIQSSGYAIVVEGYTDVIACHQADVTNAVATLGTALTREHAQILSRYCPKVVLLFDGDQAGRKAADRAVEIFFQTNIDIQMALLPEGIDPADLLNGNNGRADFDAIIASAVDALDFLLVAFQKEISANQGISGRQRLIEDFLNRLGALGYHRMSPVRRDLVIPRLAEMLAIPRETIHQSIPKPRKYANDSPTNQPPSSSVAATIEATPRSRGEQAAERGILGCLLNHPTLLVTDETNATAENEPALRDRLDQLNWSAPLFHELYHSILELVDECASRNSAVPNSMPDFEDPSLNTLATDLYWEINQQTKSGDLERVSYILDQFCKTIAEFNAEHRFNLQSGTRAGTGGAGGAAESQFVEHDGANPDSTSGRLTQLEEKIKHLRDIQANGGRRRYALGANSQPPSIPTNEGGWDQSNELDQENVTSPFAGETINQAPVDGMPEQTANDRNSGVS